MERVFTKFVFCLLSDEKKQNRLCLRGPATSAQEGEKLPFCPLWLLPVSADGNPVQVTKIRGYRRASHWIAGCAVRHQQTGVWRCFQQWKKCWSRCEHGKGLLWKGQFWHINKASLKPLVRKLWAHTSYILGHEWAKILVAERVSCIL